MSTNSHISVKLLHYAKMCSDVVKVKILICSAVVVM